jgi:acyl carrier protein
LIQAERRSALQTVITEQEERLREVVAETLGIDSEDVDDETSPQTVAAWTSLNHLTLMSAVEEAFGIQMSMEDMAVAQSYATLRETVDRLL